MLGSGFLLWQIVLVPQTFLERDDNNNEAVWSELFGRPIGALCDITKVWNPQKPIVESPLSAGSGSEGWAYGHFWPVHRQAGDTYCYKNTANMHFS